jgi:hypothetical protein
MQRVGGKRVAARFPRETSQRAPTNDIDEERKPDRPESKRIGARGRVGLPEAPDRGVSDANRENQQEPGLRERGDRLDLGVAERMILVRGLVRLANREIGQRADPDIDRVVRALGRERERARDGAGA